VSDCCLTTHEQFFSSISGQEHVTVDQMMVWCKFFSYVMARTSCIFNDIMMWRCWLCTRATRLIEYLQC